MNLTAIQLGEKEKIAKFFRAKSHTWKSQAHALPDSYVVAVNGGKVRCYLNFLQRGDEDVRYLFKQNGKLKGSLKS